MISINRACVRDSFKVYIFKNSYKFTINKNQLQYVWTYIRASKSYLIYMVVTGQEKINKNWDTWKKKWYIINKNEIKLNIISSLADHHACTWVPHQELWSWLPGNAGVASTARPARCTCLNPVLGRKCMDWDQMVALSPSGTGIFLSVTLWLQAGKKLRKWRKTIGLWALVYKRDPSSSFQRLFFIFFFLSSGVGFGQKFERK